MLQTPVVNKPKSRLAIPPGHLGRVGAVRREDQRRAALLLFLIAWCFAAFDSAAGC